MSKGKLFLIPTVISPNTENDVITSQVREAISMIDFFLVENVRTARRFISSLKLGVEIEALHFEVLDKNTDSEKVSKWLQKAENGQYIGVMSESGCPGIADPGAIAVSIAHQKDIQVVPLSGPSSIFMALMASGFSGQSFVFHGYLPIDKAERERKIRSMEKTAITEGQTQIFMDTPYRNQKLFEHLLKVCSQQTRISIAKDISGNSELIKTFSVKEWKKQKVDLHKIPVIFSLFV